MSLFKLTIVFVSVLLLANGGVLHVFMLSQIQPSIHTLVGHIWCQLYNFAVSSCQLVKSEVKREKAHKRPRSYFREIT